MNRKQTGGHNGAEDVPLHTKDGNRGIFVTTSIHLQTKDPSIEASAGDVAPDKEPDRSCVDKIFARGSQYSGGWIRAAWDFLKANELLDATRAFEKARNGFGRGKRDWKCLEEWRAYVRLRALQKAPAFVRVMLSDSFYRQLKIPPLPVPPVH